MRRILFLLCFLLSMSCQKWEPSVEQIAELCGPVSADASLLRFLQPNGDRLFVDKPYDFRVHFQTSDGHWRDLEMNSFGCVEAPREDGTLVARSLGRNWAFARLQKSSERQRYEELAVTEVGFQSWKLACPTGGWLADTMLKDAVSFSGLAGEIFDVSLGASSNKQSVKLLLQKKLGLGLADFSQILDLSLLDPGIYELNLFVGIAGPNSPSSTPVASCPLEIVRHEPTFSREAWQDGGVLSIQEKRPTSSVVAGDRLMVCRAAGFAQELDQACEPTPACRAADKFVETDGFSFDQAGRWTYVYYLKNRVGRTSPVQCRRVFVSDKAPDFAIRWNQKRWNDGRNVESSLPTQLEASFERQGHSLEAERPEGLLSCKVDFIYRGDLVAPGKGVRCLSGLCEGQSLENFVPCSSPLRFTAAQAFESELLHNSELRLTVQADDGAGQKSTKATSLFLQHSQNYIFSTSTSLNGLNKDEEVEGFWSTASGGLLVRVEGRDTIKFLETSRLPGGSSPESWHDIPSPLPADQPLKENLIALSDTGSIFASWVYVDKVDGFYRNIFSRLENGTWVPVTPVAWDPLNKKCGAFFVETADSFLCFENYKAVKPKLYRLSLDKDPEVIPLPALAKGCTVRQNLVHGIRNSHRELFLICNSEAAYRLSPAGEWQSFSLPKGHLLQTNTIVWDDQDQPWFVMRQGQSAVIVAPTRQIDGIPLPMDLVSPVGSNSKNESIGFDAKGRLRVGPYFWNPQDSIWVMDQELVEIMGDAMIQVRPVQGEPGSLIFENSQFTVLRSSNGEERLFPVNPLQWPKPAYDSFAKPFTKGVKLGPQGQLCFSENQFRTHIRCVLRKNWSQIGSPLTQLNTIPGIQNYMVSDSGEFLVAATDGIYEQSGSAWHKILPPAPERAQTWYLEGNQIWAVQSDRIYRLNRSEKIWKLVSKTGENEGVLSRLNSRRAFVDAVGQVWFTNRIQTQMKIGTRTLVKFKGEQSSLIFIPDNWDPLEFFPLDQDIIFLTEVIEAGTSQLKIMAMDIHTHAIRERNPQDWNFDFSVFAGRNLTKLASSEHQEAVAVFDTADKDFPPLVLDFRLKRQITVRQLPLDRDLFILTFARLAADNYLAVIMENGPIFSIVDNYSFRRIQADGSQVFLYDVNDMRAMDGRQKLRVTPIFPLMDSGSRMWIDPSDYLSDAKQKELFLFDLEALSRQNFWGSK